MGGIANTEDSAFALLGLTCEQYGDAERAADTGRGALQRYRRIFRDGETSGKGFGLTLPAITNTHRSDCDEGETLKFTQDAGPDARTGAQLETESVLIPMIGRKRVLTHTLCVSSQIGCAMGCTFCQTGLMGLHRNLSAARIVAQWYSATHTLGCRPSNVVFMGMGEPLDNLDEVVHAIRVLTDHNGANHPMSKICVSTVGRVDQLERLVEQVHEPGWHRLNLAVSLNAPNDAIRSEIMPINRAMPMRDLRRAIESWPIYGSAKICLEYVLIPGVNDEADHARELAEYVRGLPALVNVIPYNPRDDSPWPAPDEPDVDRFLGWLQDAGVYCKRRRTKGRDQMAACGQLGNSDVRRRAKAGTPAGVGITIGGSEPGSSENAQTQ